MAELIISEAIVREIVDTTYRHLHAMGRLSGDPRAEAVAAVAALRFRRKPAETPTQYEQRRHEVLIDTIGSVFDRHDQREAA